VSSNIRNKEPSSSRTKAPKRSRRVLRREPARAGSSSKQIDTHSPERRDAEGRGSGPQAQRPRAGEAAAADEGRLWRGEESGGCCGGGGATTHAALHRTRRRRGVQARHKVPEASGSMCLHYLDDEAEARGREGGEPEERSERGGAPSCPTPIQGSGQWTGRWRRDRRGPISRLMWIKRVEIFLAL